MPHDAPRLFYKHGTRFPRAIAWFGARSFWGHLWHLAASVIATEDIDSRDWMRADSPEDFTRRIAMALGAAHPAAPSLAEALDEDVWIDFVADTGDDGTVSAAVARMLFDRYELDDPDAPGGTTILPRGHLLVFGGDTAYPVATELEIHNRVIVPYNRVLRAVGDGETRVLLGIPGNHDWYAGLDGFHRMFHERRGRVARARREGDEGLARAGQLGHFVEWVEAFTVGSFVEKRPALPLEGYVPVQSASYWALRLAPALDLWGVDRQLRSVDFNQRLYFAEARGARGLVLCAADPAYAFLDPNPPGLELLEALDVKLERDGPLFLTGDTHHYCRQRVGRSTHVTAGGGGAFLHPARILRRAGTPTPEAEFPGPKTSLSLALRVPWAIVHGRAGLLIHGVLAVLYGTRFAVIVAGGASAMASTWVAALVAWLACFVLGGWRSKRWWMIALLAAIAGAAIGFAPYVAFNAARAGLAALGVKLPPGYMGAFAFGCALYVGTLAFGAYLMVLTLLGLEQHQAFGALAHPGYKHFLRLRVRKDGRVVDAWALGKVDPLARNEPVVLVDRFTWENPQRPPP